MSWWSWQDHNWTATLPSWNNLKVKTLWLNPNLLMTPISPHFVNQISSFIYFEVPDSGKWQRMPDDDKDCDNDESIFTSKTTFCLLRSVTKLWLDWMSCTLATLKLNLSLSLSIFLPLSFSLFIFPTRGFISAKCNNGFQKMFYFDANAVQQTLISVNTVKGIRFVLVNVNVALIMFWFI